MNYSTTFLMRSPDGENEGSFSTEENNADKVKQNEKSATPKKEKSFGERIHDALQDWSNKDQADLKFDDTRP